MSAAAMLVLQTASLPRPWSWRCWHSDLNLPSHSFPSTSFRSFSPTLLRSFFDCPSRNYIFFLLLVYPLGKDISTWKTALYHVRVTRQRSCPSRRDRLSPTRNRCVPTTFRKCAIPCRLEEMARPSKEPEILGQFELVCQQEQCQCADSVSPHSQRSRLLWTTGKDLDDLAPHEGLPPNLRELYSDKTSEPEPEAEVEPDEANITSTTVIMNPTEVAPGPPTPTPGSTYPGAGPHGLPMDGESWRHHPANRLYQPLGGNQVDHNEVNGLDGCALTGR